jgi:hypothetical protein
MEDEPVLDFLEHYGVKGMQWGVRKSSSEKAAKQARKALNKEARNDYADLQRTGQRYGYGKKYREKNAQLKLKRQDPAYAKAYRDAPGSIARRQLAIGVSMAAGYIFVNAAINRATAKSSSRPSSGDYRNGYGPGGPRNGGPRPRPGGPPKSVADIINAERDTQISSLRRTHREGFMDDAQLETFLNTLNRRYDRRIAEATGNS